MDADDAKTLERYVRDKLKAEAKDKLVEVAQVCNCIGELYAKYGRYEEAIVEHTQEKQLCIALGDCIGEAVACRKIGECYCSLEKYTQALELQKRHLTLARECQNSLEEQRAWATIGRTYLCKAESRNLMESSLANTKAEKSFFKALEACEKVKSIVKPAEYMAMKCRVLLNIGLVYDNRADVKQSTDVIKRAILIAGKHHLDEELLMCHASLASIHQNARNYTQAIRDYNQSIKLAQKERDKLREFDLFTNAALVHVALGDVVEGKHCLKKAHRLNAESDGTTKRTSALFKTVNKIQEAQNELNTTEDPNKKCELHEVLADCLADLNLYKDSIDHYLKVLTSNLLSQERKAAIYVSLAQTYSDTRQYESAIFYYNKELELRQDNPEQGCRTKLNIAELEELNGGKYTAVRKVYMEAFEMAKKAKHVKLMVRTLKSLIAVQKVCEQLKDQELTEKTLDSVRKKYDLIDEEESQEDDEDSDMMEQDDSVKEGYLSLSDLTVSEESSDDEDGQRTVASSYRKKSHIARKNEKGETPLHRACIDGNLKKVKSLVVEGHPINPRDHCGWIPLHEAANHGYSAIVEFLLEKGAWINDRGGEQCGGITPLIDAANCGHMDVMAILMRKGASLMAKDDNGKTALDCLQWWRNEYGDDLSDSESKLYKDVEKLLQDATGKSKKGININISTMSKTSKHVSLGNGQNGPKVSCISSSTTTTSSSKSSTMVKHQSKPLESASGVTSRMKRLPDLVDLGLEERKTESSSSLSDRKSSFKERLLKLREKRVTSKEAKKPRPSRSERCMNNNNDDCSNIDISCDDVDVDPVIPIHSSPSLVNAEMWNNATETYRKAMQSVRSSAQLRDEEDGKENEREDEVSEVNKKNKKVPYLEQNIDVGDDWLVDDMAYQPRAKKRNYDVTRLLSGDRIRSRYNKTASTTKAKRICYDSGDNIGDGDFNLYSESETISSNKSGATSHVTYQPLSTFESQTTSFSKKPSSATRVLDEMFGLDSDDEDIMPVQNLAQPKREIELDRNTNPGHSGSHLSGHQLITKTTQSVSSSDKETVDFWGSDDDDDLLLSSDLLYDSFANACDANTHLKNVKISNNSIDNNTFHSSSYQDSQVSSSSSSVDDNQRKGKGKKTNLSKTHYTPAKSIHNNNDSIAIELNFPKRQSNNSVINKGHNSESVVNSSRPTIEQLVEPRKVKFSVKVNIESKTLLVPIYENDENKTMSWLAQQVAERYFSSFFIYPVLTLKTPDGIILGPSDPVSSVLCTISELHTDVRAWNKQSAGDRYEKACQTFYEEPRPNVKTLLLNVGGLKNRLDMSDLSLGLCPLLPVFQALDGEKTLVELVLSGNRLSDSGVLPLTKLLTSLPNLKILVLDSNELSSDGLETLASFIQNGSGLQSLTDLSLSYNCLTDTSEASVKILLKSLRNLTTLKLGACYLTSNFFTSGLLKAFSDSTLTTLTLSENQFTHQAIHSTLLSLHTNSTGLKHLDLAHSLSPNTPDPAVGLDTVLQPITSRVGCLQSLSLAGCQLSKNDVLVINRLPALIPTLIDLNISLNRNIENTSLHKLISISASDQSQLKTITARGCGLRSPLGDELLDALKFKLQSKAPLTRLVLSCRGMTSAESDLLSRVWMERWDEVGKVKASGMILDLSVTLLFDDGNY